MIFKQKVLKEEKIKLLIVTICSVLPLVVIIVYALIRREDFKSIMAVIVMFLPIYFLLALLGLRYLEYYCVYADHIEVRNVYGIVNSVYFSNVLFVEEVEINLIKRGMERTFYIFNDGRRNNNNIFDINSCYNNKKNNLRIYKTQELENYIKTILKIEIIQDK